MWPSNLFPLTNRLHRNNIFPGGWYSFSLSRFAKDSRMSYLSFLQYLLALGPKLPLLLADIQAIVEGFKRLLVDAGLSPADLSTSLSLGASPPLGGSPGTDDLNAIATVEQQLQTLHEQTSSSLLMASGAQGSYGGFGAPGNFLDNVRTLFQFLESSGLLQIVLALLQKAGS